MPELAEPPPMTAADTWTAVPPDQLPRDPWPHEHGEDPAHELDPAGHVPEHHDAMAHLLSEPRPVPEHPHLRQLHTELSTGATYALASEFLAFSVLVLLYLSTNGWGIAG